MFVVFYNKLKEYIIEPCHVAIKNQKAFFVDREEKDSEDGISLVCLIAKQL